MRIRPQVNPRTLLALLLAGVLATALVSCATPSATTDAPAPHQDASATAAKDTHLVILATSDMHGSIWGYSYEDGTETADSGMARLYTYIEQVRAENPNVLLVDAGDAIQGQIITDDFANKNPDDEHPVMAAMNAMGYDAMTVGNHEFNWGVDTMRKIVGQAAFPVLSANILGADGTPVTGKGWTIVERGGIRIAIIGVCTPDIPVWDLEKPGIKDLTFEPASVAVTRSCAEIGDAADLVLVSAHMGLEPEYDFKGLSDAARKIVEDNPEVDILQVAHLHLAVDERVGSVPVVGVRNLATQIARIDVTLAADGTLTDVKTEIVDMEGVEPSQEIRDVKAVRELHEKAVAYVGGLNEDGSPAKPLGETTASFQPKNEILGLPEHLLRDTAVADLILNVELINSGADVAATPLFKDASDLPAGPINYGNVFDIYKHDNTLYTLDVTGAELKDYMEWSAACYNQWTPGDINVSLQPTRPSYTYDMFQGVDYEINLSKPVGERIENVRFHGAPLADDEVLKLAVNNYRYASAIQSQHLAKANYDWESATSIRDMIVDYFATHSPVEPTVDDNWRITGIDLSEDDPRRAEIIGYINDELLPTPYEASYNLADYDKLVAEAEYMRASGKTVLPRQPH